MNARTAKDLLGPALIGCFITTEAVGEYPGGRARVIELDPDPAAPEIVMTVRHRSWKNEDGLSAMGIFEWEEVSL